MGDGAPAGSDAAASNATGHRLAAVPPADSMPCRPWIDQALDAVAANRLEDAADLLGEAGRACPASRWSSANSPACDSGSDG
jgi:hypothetical protein